MKTMKKGMFRRPQCVVGPQDEEVAGTNRVPGTLDNIDWAIDRYRPTASRSISYRLQYRQRIFW